jgi:putative tryptophan/tyrosine transport system substrate-binding protein
MWINRKVKRIFTIVFMLLASVNVSAAIYVVHDIEESSVRSLTFQLSKLLPTKTQLIPVRRTLFLQNVSVMKSDDVLVTVGAESFRQVCSAVSEGAVMAVFIGKEEYLRVRPKCSVPNSAVFSGAPLAKRLALLEAVWFDRKPLAVLYSDNLLVDEQEMINQATQYGFEFQFIKTEIDRLSVLKSVNFVLEDSMVIFSLVDTELYKNGIAQDMLKLLFHKQRVMIGPSFAFVRAGSLFAIYSDTEAKLDILADRIGLWQTKGVLLDAAYPDKLRVSFNPYLIKSHGVVLPSPSYLKDKYGLCSETSC